jgi:hypothetical protein
MKVSMKSCLFSYFFLGFMIFYHFYTPPPTFALSCRTADLVQFPIPDFLNTIIIRLLIVIKLYILNVMLLSFSRIRDRCDSIYDSVHVANNHLANIYYMLDFLVVFFVLSTQKSKSAKKIYANKFTEPRQEKSLETSRM